MKIKSKCSVLDTAPKHRYNRNMQTFLTDKHHHNTARSLDRQRLVKQLLEGRQILETINKPEYTEDGKVTPWHHHPAIEMWKGHEGALLSYLTAIKTEMHHRGYKYQANWDAILAAMTELADKNQIGQGNPPWMRDADVYNNIIATHRHSLYNKDSEYYAEWDDQHGDVCCANCGYYWPIERHGYVA